MRHSQVKRTRVKICGITRSDDARSAIEAGADAIGLVFWPQSSRAVSIDVAKHICRAVPAFVSIVALTVDATRDEVREIVDSLPVTMMQFHGNESPEFCQSFNVPFIKAIRMRPGVDLNKEITRYQTAQGILLDTYQKGLPGGTGESFDWRLIPESHRNSIVLAGGLNAQNIFQAVKQLRPYAVDVSGGVELSPGVKDSQKINEFIANVHLADHAEYY